MQPKRRTGKATRGPNVPTGLRRDRATSGWRTFGRQQQTYARACDEWIAKAVKILSQLKGKEAQRLVEHTPKLREFMEFSDRKR